MFSPSHINIYWKTFTNVIVQTYTVSVYCISGVSSKVVVISKLYMALKVDLCYSEGGGPHIIKTVLL